MNEPEQNEELKAAFRRVFSDETLDAQIAHAAEMERWLQESGFIRLGEPAEVRFAQHP